MHCRYFAREVHMAKKLCFLLLVLALMVIGTLVSMADEDETAVKTVTGLSAPVVNTVEEGQYIEKYTHEAVLEKYGSLFFDEESQSSCVLIKEYIVKKNVLSDNIQDRVFSGELADDITLKNGDSVVVMVFVKNGDTYELLGTPKEAVTNYLRLYRLRLPFVGEDKPNHIRVVAFLKSRYKELALDKNVQITDMDITIQKQGYNIKDSLMNTLETLELFDKFGE